MEWSCSEIMKKIEEKLLIFIYFVTDISKKFIQTD